MTDLEKLKIVIMRTGLEDSAFSEKIGYHKNYIGKILRGERILNNEQIEKICKAVEVTKEYFDGIDKEGINTGNHNINIASETSGIVLQKSGTQDASSEKLLRDLLQQKDEVINLLKEKIKRLEEQLINKK